MLKIMEKTKLWFSISLIIIVIGMGFLCFRGLNFGIDFKGGTEVSIQLNENINKEDVDVIVKNYAPDASTNTTDNYQYAIKSTDLDSDKLSSIMTDLKDKYQLDDTALLTQDEIGASVGKELTKEFNFSTTCIFCSNAYIYSYKI